MEGGLVQGRIWIDYNNGYHGGVWVFGGMQAPLWMLPFNRWYGAYLNESSLVAHRGVEVKSSHDIQSLRLFFKKQVTYVWVFICTMNKVAKQGVFHCHLCLSNVIFHIQYDKTSCIGVCDWELVPKLRRSQAQIMVVGPRMKNNTQNLIGGGCTMIFFTCVTHYLHY